MVADSFLIKPSSQEEEQVPALEKDDGNEKVEEIWHPTASPVTIRSEPSKGLYSDRLITFTFLRIPLKTTKGEKPGRKGLKLKALYELQGGNGSGVAPQQENQIFVGKGKGKENRKSSGVGFYEWVVWEESVDGKKKDGFEDGEGEVVHSLVEVVDALAEGGVN